MIGFNDQPLSHEDPDQPQRDVLRLLVSAKSTSEIAKMRWAFAERTTRRKHPVNPRQLGLPLSGGGRRLRRWENCGSHSW